jgi:hypothetical protein
MRSQNCTHDGYVEIGWRVRTPERKMKPARSECEAQRDAAFGGARFPAHPQERHFWRGIECTLATPAL